MNNLHFIGYQDALTDNEMLLYSLIINKFKNGEIDFKNLKNEFLNYGITIEVMIADFSKKMMTLAEAASLKKRISEENYLYNDIKYYVLNAPEFENVVFRMDYKAIEALANHGIPEYKEAMICILKTQLKYSFNKDENWVIQRNKMKRKINELKLELSKNDIINGKVRR